MASLLCRVPPDGPEPIVTFTDGSAVHSVDKTESVHQLDPDSMGEFRGYLGTWLHPRAITALPVTPQHRLALFHYQTRSLEDYEKKLENALSFESVKYLHYCETRDIHPEDPRSLQRWEKYMEWDRETKLCSSAIDAEYWKRF
jgi:hypothetical protein